jgi:hypothetical protein
MATSNKQHDQAVLEVAKMIASHKEAVITLSGNVRAKLIGVPATLIDEVSSRIQDPEVPMWHNPDKDRDEPNPSDPGYIKGLSDAARQRGLAAIDAMCMFGVELIDPVPDKGVWLKKLQYLEKRGNLDLSSYNLEDPMDIEYLWKRFIAVDATVIQAITKLSGISQEEIAEAERSFRGQ